MDLIYYIKMILIGLVQGLTEPLPISSSAHMTILKEMFNVEITNISFEILINFASSIAIAIFFREKIYYLIKNTITNKQTKYKHLNRTYLLKLLIASIPICIVGLLVKDKISFLFSSTFFVSFFLLVTSLMLFITSKMIQRKKILTDEISIFDSILIGLGQSLSVAPGISRSGTTFFFGTSKNTKLESLFEFSFFLYLIASFGSLVLSVIDLDILSFINSQNKLLLLVVFITTFISTLFSIKLFHKILSKQTILIFSVYTLLLGLFLLIYNLLLLIPMQI